MNKDIKRMSRKELIELSSNLLDERGYKVNSFNKVSVCDVEVESNIESLDKCKNVVNDLIERHKNFITLRRSKIKCEEFGYFG